ncbi:MAG: hypothetical protein AAF497_20420 [Planctomycetota bacterium]
MIHSRIHHCLPICLLAFLLVGCEPESKWDRIPLTGTATLDGKPFTGGIVLKPARGVHGPSATTNVGEGEFRFRRSEGPVAGKHMAILLPKSKFGDRNDFQLEVEVDVPTAEPFEVKLALTTPKEGSPDRPRIPPAEEEAAKK